MNEDKEFNDFLKGRLEHEVSHDPPGLDRIMRTASEVSRARTRSRRLRNGLWGALLAAASLAVISAVSFNEPQPVLQPKQKPEPQELVRDETVTTVIELLCTEEELESIPEGASAVEQLLAWQDVPYDLAVSDIALEY